MTPTSKPTCLVPDCGQPTLTAGRCRKHYAEHRLARFADLPCSVANCPHPQYCKQLCRGHYARQRDGRSLDSLLEARQPRQDTTRIVLLLPAETIERLSARARPGERLSATVRRLLASV